MVLAWIFLEQGSSCERFVMLEVSYRVIANEGHPWPMVRIVSACASKMGFMLTLHKEM